MSKQLTTLEFIKRAKFIHGDKYDYSKTKYTGMKDKIDIICPEHGVFKQRPNDHLNKKIGCPKCSTHFIPTTKEFIEKAKLIHGDKYDYSQVIYKNMKSKMDIICPEHGVFKQTPDVHLNKKAGCFKCRNRKPSLTTQEFIKQSNIVHKNNYDYSQVKYVESHQKVKIICPEHGFFTQRPNNHLHMKHKCPVCSRSGGKSKQEMEVVNYIIGLMKLRKLRENKT